VGSQPVNPGSGGRLDWSSGFYLGGYLAGAIVQYILMNNSGITVVSPTQITLQAPNVTITASTELTVTSPLAAFSDEVTIADDAVIGMSDYLEHTHTSESPGSPTSPPIV
jgi:hypothetical protein